MLDMQGFEEMSSPFSVICLWKKERGWGGGGAWLRVVSKEREWNKKSKNDCQVQKHRSILPALNRGRRSGWMWSGCKDLEEEERHRKVLLLEPLSLPLHFALPSPLLNFPCLPSLWQNFKWVKSKPAEARCLGELWWKKAKSKDISSEIWSKTLLVFGYNLLKAQRIPLIIHHTDS